MRRGIFSTTTRGRRSFSSSRVLWIGLAVLALTVVAFNLYVLAGSGSRLLPRPRVPGILSPPAKEPLVLSKQGSGALRAAPARKPKPIPNDDGKDRVVQILTEATITVNASLRERLPTWDQVVRLYGSKPVLQFGHDGQACQRFRDAVPPLQRMLGAAGMFSTGTNLVTTLLKRNCQIPERAEAFGPKATREQYGMRWQVPWGKHTPAHYRDAHATEKASQVAKDDLLPVVTIRHPYTWMRSMCKHPYSCKWAHRGPCPTLQTVQGDWNEVTVTYAAGTENHTSLAHLYNDWYHGYSLNATYPWVMIRMEDLIFHTQETITAVCECAGGVIPKGQPFYYTVDSAKADSPGHDTSVGFYEAWIRYSQDPEAMGGFSALDYEASRQVLDAELMKFFGYEHPPAA